METGLRPLRKRPKNGVLAPVQRISSVPDTQNIERPENCCLIYFFGDPDGKIVKFGKTRNQAETRKKQHERRGYEDVEMRFLCALWGHDADESSLIDHCQKLGIVLPKTNEWVNAADERFRSWLRWLRNQAFVANDPTEINDLPFVDWRYWLPNEKNRFESSQIKLAFNDDAWSDLEISEETEGDYYTNEILIGAARQTMGQIDLDPASCRVANKVVQATRFYGALQDGLRMPWGGKVWLNPPFGQWNYWADKALRELRSGRIKEMCIFMTANAATSRQVLDLIRTAGAVFISSGRYNCWGPKATAAAEGNLIFYFGDDPSRFQTAFTPYGTVFVHSEAA